MVNNFNTKPFENFKDYFSLYLDSFKPSAIDYSILYTAEYKSLVVGLQECFKGHNKLGNIAIKLIELNNVDDMINKIESVDFSLIFFDLESVYHEGKLQEYYFKTHPKLSHLVSKFMFMRDIGDSFCDIYAHAPSKISGLNSKLVKALERSKLLNINCINGTNLSAIIKDNKWTDTNGYNSTNTLTPSEVSSSSSSINGEVNFIGGLQSQIPIGLKHGYIDSETMIQIVIKDSKVVHYSCTKKSLYNDLDKYFTYCDENREVVELGIGTNIGIKKLTGNSAPHEERHPGFHLGIGGRTSHSQHLDFIFQDSIISTEHQVLFKNKQFHV